ncbi:TolC family protein [Leptobacterium flavescens]|uniref:TolC family protein n=1 Tax=Leptobacterium flavescens TaxID=472055 RepID=A0A6P0UQB6_9FLAO|nr:TolC family protein [Leptobacterium flavescens]NER13073.1 TolC family protein [Leptobacterium flavescens]
MNPKFLLIALCFVGVLQAQEKKLSFTLDEAITYALENNRAAINADRDIDAAKKQKWETTATGLPQISAKIDYQNFLKQQVTLFDTNGDGIDEEFTFGTRQSVNAVATLEQLLFDGSYLVGLQSAKVFLEISKNAKVKTDLEVRKSVIDAYGNVLLAEESVAILTNNQAVLQKNVNETQKIFENGLAEEEDLEQLQITLANVTSNLNNTKRLRDVAYKLFNITLGIELDAEVTLTEKLEALAIQNINENLNSAPLSLESNIDYKIADNNKRSQELLLKLEKSRALPTLNAFVNGGYQGFSDEFTFLDSGQRYFGSSLIGVSLNIPVFSSLQRSAKTQRAKIELEKAKTDLEDTEQRLRLQLVNAKSNYQFAIEQYLTSKKNLELAERIERKNQVKYSEGIATSFELRQAQTQLYTTQQEYLQAMLDVINNKAELETILNSDTLVKSGK